MHNPWQCPQCARWNRAARRACSWCSTDKRTADLANADADGNPYTDAGGGLHVRAAGHETPVIQPADPYAED